LDEVVFAHDLDVLTGVAEGECACGLAGDGGSGGEDGGVEVADDEDVGGLGDVLHRDGRLGVVHGRPFLGVPRTVVGLFEVS